MKGEELKLDEERRNSSRRRTASRWTTWTTSWIKASSFLINVIYAWVVLVFKSSLVRITLHYFTIYAHISPIMLGLGLFGFCLQIYAHRK